MHTLIYFGFWTVFKNYAKNAVNFAMKCDQNPTNFVDLLPKASSWN